MTEYMISLRKDAGNGVGTPRYLMFDDAVSDPGRLNVKQWSSRIIATFPKKPVPGGVDARVGEVLFLVHGFNVSHEDARKFHLKAAQGLRAAGWEGLVISFDWPSDGFVFAYAPDRVNARAAASALVSAGIGPLQALQQADCRIKVHVLAHSMGGFVVQQAFTWAYQDVEPNWAIAQLMFVAADVDNSVFDADNASAKAFARHAARLTAYCNRYDKSLAVSQAKRAGFAPRMGRVGLPADAPTMMCEVDCSLLFNATHPGDGPQLDPVATHCFYFDQNQFWRDVTLTLGGGLDRSIIPTRAPAAPPSRPSLYELRPKPIEDGAYRGALVQAQER